MGAASFEMSFPERVLPHRQCFPGDCGCILRAERLTSAGGNRCQLRPEQVHRFTVRWEQRLFELFVDDVGIFRARARHDVPDAVSPLARLFVWVFARRGVNWNTAFMRPVPSQIQLRARLTCFLCNQESSLLLPHWSVCPVCNTWICSRHIRQSPTRSCPRCPNQLLDYVGAGDPCLTLTHCEWLRLSHVWRSRVLSFNCSLVSCVSTQYLCWPFAPSGVSTPAMKTLQDASTSWPSATPTRLSCSIGSVLSSCVPNTAMHGRA